MDLALRIRMDLGQATQEVTQLDSAVDKLGAAGKQASTGLTTLGNATDRSTASHRQHAAAVKTDAAALTDIERKAARAGISVGQYGMAMRMLPAQMTDISVGLATGQSPFMVLMQQGGQLKDSFGGIVPAARAVGGSIMGLVNPYTVAAVAVAGLGLAWAKQQAELSAYNQALILTNGYAGRTVEQLQAMAGALQGVGHGTATEALTEVAASGRFAGEAFDQVSAASARMKEIVGREVSDTITAFQAIQDEPVKALLKLNATEHFLTQAQLDRVQALIAEGQEQLAVAEATRIYSDHLLDVADRAEAARTPIERLWGDVKKWTSDATAEVASFANWLVLIGEEANKASKWSLLVPGWNAYTLWQASDTVAMQAQQGPQAAPGRTPTVDSKAAQAAIDEQKKRDREREAFLNAETRYLNDAAKKKRDIAAVNDLVTRSVINQEEATKRIAQIEADYAERAKRAGGQKKSDAQRAEEDARRELENLQKEAAMLGTLEDGQKRVSREATIRYEIEKGGYRAASAAAKAALLDAARLVDQRQAERAAEEEKRREFEKTERAYDQLRATLRTPAEVAVETTIERIKTLNDAIKQGSVEATNYGAQLDKIVNAAFSAAPTFPGLSPEIGGVDSEQYRLQQQKDALETWYTDQLSRLEEFRKQRADLNAQWDAQELQLREQHSRALATLNQAQNQLMLQQSADAFGSMAQVAKAYGGEQSRTYRVLFAISKGFAVAQAAVALAQNVAEASKAGFPQNIGFIAGALAQGATIASLLSAAQYATGGRITGPGTGTSDDVPIWASAGEYMVRHASASQPGAYAFLEDFNARGMAALEDWRGYAAGGEITAAPEPRGRVAEGGGSRAASVSNSMRLYNLFDIDQLAQALANHPSMEKAVVTYASQNGQAIQAEW